MSCGRCENVAGERDRDRDRDRCRCNQVGGAQTFPCQREVNRLKRDIEALERCLLASVTPPVTPRPCRCCCCCCHQHGNTAGNQTSWGR